MALGEPRMWEDITAEHRKGIAGEINRIGKGTATNTQSSISKLREASGSLANSPDYQAKTASIAGRLEAIGDQFKDKPITMRGAVTRRVGAWERAVGSAREAGGALPGAGWYLEHAASIHEHRGNIPFSQAAAASAVLSPGKDPKGDELPAFKTLAELHQGEHTITRGKETSRVASMSAEQLGSHLSTAAKESSAGGKKTITSSHPEFHVGGRAHRPNTVKSIKTIRGQIGSAEANPPETSPKTASYERSILTGGTASTAEELDYRGIAHHVVHGEPGQGMLQFSQSESGGPAPHTLLSGIHHTAEDTWMQAITSGQSLRAKSPEGRTISPAKRAVDKGGPGAMERFSKRNAGIAGDKSVTPVSVVHAYNNRATRSAAEAVGPVSFSQHGEDIRVPAIMMQEVSWTQARREAGGDAPFNQAQRRQEVFAEHTRRDPQMFSGNEPTAKALPPRQYQGGGKTQQRKLF